MDACLINDLKSESNDWHELNEVFAPALSLYEIEQEDPTRYLKKAIAYSNEKLYGTLGANIIIHPRTIRKIGTENFEKIIQELRYGTLNRQNNTLLKSTKTFHYREIHSEHPFYNFWVLHPPWGYLFFEATLLSPNWRSTPHPSSLTHNFFKTSSSGNYSSIQRISCQRLRLRPYLPHAPGVRMKVVKLTPLKELTL